MVAQARSESWLKRFFFGNDDRPAETDETKQSKINLSPCNPINWNSEELHLLLKNRRRVMDGFMEAVGQAKRSLLGVRDTSALPYPKTVILSAIKVSSLCLHLTQSEDSLIKESNETSTKMLADFQPIENRDRKRLKSDERDTDYKARTLIVAHWTGEPLDNAQWKKMMGHYGESLKVEMKYLWDVLSEAENLSKDVTEFTHDVFRLLHDSNITGSMDDLIKPTFVAAYCVDRKVIDDIWTA